MKYLQLFVIFLAFAGSSAYAAPKMYAEVDAMRTEVQVDGVKFKPYQGKVKFGYYVQPKVALEVHYVPSGDDADGPLNLEIDKLYGAYLRLESNLHNRVRLYLLGGYAETELNYTSSSGSLSSKDGGISWGIGLEDQMVRLRNTFFTLEYMNYYDKDGFEITGISLGFRYLF